MTDQMYKGNISLTQTQVKELNSIERESDVPRTRLIRRAIEEYLARYRKANPEWAAKHVRPQGGFEEFEREFKKGVETDIIALRGKRQLVVINPDGSWRLPREEDYVTESDEPNSILDKQ